MMKYDKVENPSDYWCDFESDLSVYFHLKWIGQQKIHEFINYELEFIKKYASLTYKYGLVMPVNYNEEDLMNEYKEYELRNESNGITGSNLMYFLYNSGLGLDKVYPSNLFININDKSPKTIIKIDPLTELKDIKDAYIGYGSIPFRVELLKKETEIKILCYLDNDIFNLGLENIKCREFEYPIDNSDLAYLNTPRLNSFLRDLKKLCFEYGASDFEFEDLGLYDFCEDGVKFGEEVVYYEDIVEMLKPHQRIVQ